MSLSWCVFCRLSLWQLPTSHCMAGVLHVHVSVLESIVHMCVSSPLHWYIIRGMSVEPSILSGSKPESRNSLRWLVIAAQIRFPVASRLLKYHNQPPASCTLRYHSIWLKTTFLLKKILFFFYLPNVLNLRQQSGYICLQVHNIPALVFSHGNLNHCYHSSGSHIYAF